jgi:hypothetical protein
MTRMNIQDPPLPVKQSDYPRGTLRGTLEKARLAWIGACFQEHTAR